MTLEFKPLHRHFAAEVQGFDMRQPIDAATARDFERAIDRYAVLVFPAQQVDDAQQLAFTANFGPPDIGRKKAVKSADSRIPEEMIDLSNLDENGYVIDPNHRRVLSLLGTRLWHSDSSYQRPAAKYSMLRAVTVPPWGGETEFADCRAAYDALPEVLRAEAEDRFAEHWVHHSRSTLGWEPTEEEIRGAMPPVRWPLVRVHPGSGRKALYIGAHARRVIGMALPAGPHPAARSAGTRDAAGIRLSPRLAAGRSGAVGQPRGHAPRLPLRSCAGARHAADDGARSCVDARAGLRRGGGGGLTRVSLLGPATGAGAGGKSSASPV